MLYRYCTVFLLMCFAVPALAEMAMTRVVEVQRSGVPQVVLAAGRDDGLDRGHMVTLLREGEAIVHPLTGDVLGVPQEPVGVAEVRSVEAKRAVAVLIKTYSVPQVGDMGEFEKVQAKGKTSGTEEPEAVAQVMERVRGLEKDIKKYKKSQKTLSAYPVFAQQVWDEMGTIKSYLVTLDERLIELEAQQGEDRNRLSQVISGEYQTQEAKELTIRYSEDTDIRLQVAGKTLIISIEGDSLHLEEVDAAAMSAAVAGLSGEGLELEEEEGAAWWDIDLSVLDSPYVSGGIIAFIIVLGGVAYLMIKRYSDVVDGLDEFDQEYAGIDEDFDDEDFDDEDFADEERRA